MKTVLICPGARLGVPALARRMPLPLVPFLGRSALHYTLSSLASRGVREILILAPDRPDEIRSAVSFGEPWGLRAEVMAVEREPGEAEIHALAASAIGVHPHGIVRLDCVPGFTELPLWDNYRIWREALCASITPAAAAQVGIREVSPNVFVGLRSRVSPSARLIGPCWIGQNVRIGAHAVVGPGAVVEDGCYLDTQCSVADSVVGPKTYLGVLTNLQNSLAWGSELIHLGNGQRTEVIDPILLAEVHRPVWRDFGLLYRMISRAFCNRKT